MKVRSPNILSLSSFIIHHSSFIICFAALFIFLGLVWHYVWMSGDGWWYLALGREIFGCKCLPEYNNLAFTGHWTMVLHQQWLPYVLYYGAFRLDGYSLVYAITAAMIAGGLGATLAAAKEKNASISAGIIILFLGALAYRRDFNVRSEPLIDLLFGLEVWLFVRARAGNKTPFWALIPVFILWANSHSSLPLAVVYPLVFLFGWWVDKKRGDADSGLKYIVVWLTIAIAATLINPYGPYIYKDIYLRLKSPSIDVIEIFKSPDFHDPYNFCQGLWMLFLWLGLMISSRRTNVTDLMVCGAFSILFLNAQRYFIFLVIATAPVAAMHWGEIAGRWFRRPAWKHVLAAACISGGILFFSMPRYYQSIVGNVKDATNYMKAAGVTGRVFNYYSWGGYLLWEHPEMKIFIDGRNNIYEESGVFDDYRAAARGGRYWKELFDIYAINAVIWHRGEIGLYSALLNDPDWKPLFVRGEAVVFLRNTPQNSIILKTHQSINP